MLLCSKKLFMTPSSFPYFMEMGEWGTEGESVMEEVGGGELCLLLPPLLLTSKHAPIRDPIRIMPLMQIDNAMSRGSRVDLRWRIVEPLTLRLFPVEQPLLVQSDGVDHVGRVGDVADLVGRVLIDIAIAHHRSGGLVAVDQSGEDADAVEGIFLVLAHVADGEVDGRPGVARGLRAEHLLGALVGERVGVQADAVIGAEDGARGVLLLGHVGDGVEGEAAVGARDGGVVLDQVALLGAGGAAVGAMPL